MRLYLNLLTLLFIFLTATLIFSQPQILYSHSGGSSHEHPHDPEKTVCAYCAELVTPGNHSDCPELKKRDDKIKAQEEEIERLKKEKEEKGKIDTLKTWVGAIPVVGDIGEVVIEEIAKRATPRADCPRCPDKVWKTTDHRQTCYNAGHPGGSYTFYSCENSGRCTNESVHISRPLDPVLSNYELCDYCGKKVYDGGSHQCSSN